MHPLRPTHAARNPRRGLATLEAALCLPVLAGLMAIIFTLASAGLTKSEASIQARYDAWTRREDRRADARLPVTGSGGDVGRILGFTSLGQIPPSTGTLPPDAGLIVEQTRKSVPTAYPGYRNWNLTAVETHRVLAGTWDFREVTFPSGELKPDPRFAYFAPPGADTLAQLGNLAGGIPGGSRGDAADQSFQVGDSESGIGDLARKIAGIVPGGDPTDPGDFISDIADPGTLVDLGRAFGISLLDLAKSIPGVGEVVGVLEDVGDAIGDGIEAVGDFLGL